MTIKYIDSAGKIIFPRLPWAVAASEVDNDSAAPGATVAAALDGLIARAPRILTPIGFYPQDAVSVTINVNETAYFQYMGRWLWTPPASIKLAVEVTTAYAATGIGLKWAEVGFFKGTPVAGAGASLVELGITDVAALFNSTGIKLVTVALSGMAAGDDWWIGFGQRTTTKFQLRATLPDLLTTGVHQQVGCGPLTTLGNLASPITTTLAAASLNGALAGVRIGI